MSLIYNRRVRKLLDLLKEKELDGVIIMDSSTIFYFTGTDAPQAFILGVDQQEPILLSSLLEFYRARDEKHIGNVYGFSRDSSFADKFKNIFIGDFNKSVSKIIKKSIGESKKIGLVAKNISCSSYNKLKEALGFEPVNLWEDISYMRTIKDEYEISLLKKSINITERVLEKTIEYLKTGITEAEIVGFIQNEFRKNNSLDAFFPIVAFGEHSKHPHAVPSLRKLRRGDLVKIDIGARHMGYCADITRTFVYGHASEKQRRLISIVLEAQENASSSIVDSMKASMIDLAARDIFRKYGLAEFFIHSLGHGVGVDVHESPYIASTSKDIIVDGMVFTIEPGLYIDGFGGIRIEDMIYVKNGKPIPLTSFKKVIEID